MTETHPYEAVVIAVEKEEGRMAPKKRLAILAALECFAQYGFDGTSTKMIAQKAGIGEATIFRHFPTKRDFLLRLTKPVVRHVLAPEAAHQAETFLTHRPGDPRQFIREALLTRLHWMRLYAPLVRIVMQEVLVNDDLRDMLAGEIGPFFVQLGEVIAMVGAETPAQKERFIRTVASLVGGYFLHSSVVARDRDWSDEDELDFILTVVFQGIGAALLLR
ncbi:TetR/AcrR family transcriptional regulator [Maritimibacter sp. DP1N21-5]|uniref:TetR/AcrR family transcriptional regulator n=1 Tax=Maritimibacter sp. DP1N21-5 TaxID=2836867 RepID=UPI001C446E79|nr:TetR/AcrR family transcriptional regulator [Maritimibacter sp. DP1N21-5]MBV7408795.1 TetR/AcrR family transcriptional regulator [Maritimibacter sp. DP1N21-5]